MTRNISISTYLCRLSMCNDSIDKSKLCDLGKLYIKLYHSNEDLFVSLLNVYKQ